ncbi:MAG: Lrp/AsnC family transcriptional regulator [Candidatus Micrarchaeia archaeon]|jgi:DNA-binding Lrp family transcriptional regulator
MGVKYDKLDLMLISELRNDCKQSVRALSKKLGSHPNTILLRIKNLEKEGIVLKYAAVINFNKIGYDLHSLIWVKVDKKTRSEWDILTELSKFSELVAGYAITGTYDALVVARTKDRTELTALLKKINTKNYIIETKTELVLETFKHDYEFNPLWGKIEI